MRPLRPLHMTDRKQRLLQQLLQICLPHIDHVVDVGRAPEKRMILLTVVGAGRPQRPSWPRREHAILEVAAEQSQLPELIGDVLADIRHHAVGTDDHLFALLVLIVLLVRRARFLVDLHHPAAGQAAFARLVDGALRLQHVERLCPELEPQDVALPREQVVVDVHPRHRPQVTVDDAVGDERGDGGVLVPAMLDVVQGRGTHVQPLLVLLVPLGDARVQVPAVVVEARRIGDLADLVERLVLERAEADHHVGDLNAGVVDVVLHLDGHAAEAQRADERVAKRGVAQVSDVRRLVGVDGGVLDDRLARPAARRPTDRACEPLHEERGAVEEEIEVAVRRRRHLRHALDGTECRGNLLRDRPGRLPQPPGELEGDRGSEVAERTVRRIVEHHLRLCAGVERIQRREHTSDVIAEAIVESQDHLCYAFTRSPVRNRPEC